MATKYQPIIEYYNRVAAILCDRLPYIPALQLTYGKTYYGSFWKSGGRSAISLSVVRCWPVDHDELIDVIAHELAHTIWPEHNQLHAATTRHFVDIVNQNWMERSEKVV